MSLLSATQELSMSPALRTTALLLVLLFTMGLAAPAGASSSKATIIGGLSSPSPLDASVAYKSRSADRVHVFLRDGTSVQPTVTFSGFGSGATAGGVPLNGDCVASLYRDGVIVYSARDGKHPGYASLSLSCIREENGKRQGFSVHFNDGTRPCTRITQEGDRVILQTDDGCPATVYARNPVKNGYSMAKICVQRSGVSVRIEVATG